MMLWSHCLHASEGDGRQQPKRLCFAKRNHYDSTLISIFCAYTHKYSIPWIATSKKMKPMGRIALLRLLHI